MVVIVFGLPGSGKSYFASRLAKQLNAMYVNSDQLRLQLIDERSYAETEKLQVYDAMLAAMTTCINQQKNVLLDGTFYKKAIRIRFEKRAAELDATVFYIEVKANEDIIRERVSKPREFSEADFEVYLKLKTIAEPLVQDHLILQSTNDNITAMLQDALVYLKTEDEQETD